MYEIPTLHLLPNSCAIFGISIKLPKNAEQEIEKFH